MKRNLPYYPDQPVSRAGFRKISHKPECSVTQIHPGVAIPDMTNRNVISYHLATTHFRNLKSRISSPSWKALILILTAKFCYDLDSFIKLKLRNVTLTSKLTAEIRQTERRSCYQQGSYHLWPGLGKSSTFQIKYTNTGPTPPPSP